MSSPIYNPPVPYSGGIPGGFMPGRMVRVQGRVNPSAQAFQINLQSGPNPYDDVALLVCPRFNESVIIRNSRTGSGWGTEERHGPPLPIYRDQNFEILILSEPSLFKIAVNGQHFTEFTHRLPLDRVNYLAIEGDLTLSLIQFDGTPSSSAYTPSAPHMGYASAPSGGVPYPPASALPAPGFTMPPSMPSSSPYPAAGAPMNSGYPGPPPAQPYGGYPPAAQQYPTAGAHTGYPQQSPYPGTGAPGGYPGGGHYQPQGHGSGSGRGGGILSDASKLLAGGLAGVGLAKVANKIPGMGGGHGHGGGGHGFGLGQGHHGGHHGGGGGGLGAASGILGTAAALGIGGAMANKGMKKNKSKNLMKYGVPIGGAVLGGYALKKGMKGFKHHGHGSSSSSSSSSEEE